MLSGPCGGCRHRLAGAVNGSASGVLGVACCGRVSARCAVLRQVSNGRPLGERGVWVGLRQSARSEIDRRVLSVWQRVSGQSASAFEDAAPDGRTDRQDHSFEDERQADAIRGERLAGYAPVDEQVHTGGVGADQDVAPPSAAPEPGSPRNARRQMSPAVRSVSARVISAQAPACPSQLRMKVQFTMHVLCSQPNEQFSGRRLATGSPSSAKTHYFGGALAGAWTSGAPPARV